nr:uncharacterized protein LOC110376584 [Helicoverpa armigera]
MSHTKQLKITKLFRKGASKLPEDSKELQEEIEQLELQLKEKKDEMFQLQRNSYRHKASPVKKKRETFTTRPQKICLSNAVDRLKVDLELMSVLSGMEVQSYVLEDHCCIVYHMQHPSEYEVKHGLRIELKNGVNEVSKSSLPLGFNLDAVMEDFDNIMLPGCLGAIRKALVAYYNRLQQYEALKKLLNIEAQLFKFQDGSHIEIAFVAQNEMDEEAEQFDMVLMLDYRLYDIRPKQFSFKEIDLPEGAAEVLSEQCAIFKRKPLHKAFRETFIDGAGPYKFVEQVGSGPVQQPRRRRFRPARRDYNNDDTFLPEDCSEHSDDGDVA